MFASLLAVLEFVAQKELKRVVSEFRGGTSGEGEDGEGGDDDIEERVQQVVSWRCSGVRIHWHPWCVLSWEA